MSEEKVSPAKNIIVTIISATFFFGFALPRFLKEVKSVWREHEHDQQVEISKHLTEQGQQFLNEGRYLEAKKSFDEARENDANNETATIGIAESVSYLETPDAGLNVLADCSSETCAQEKAALHSRAFDKILAEGPRPENVVNLFNHGIAVTTPICTVEKILGKTQATLTGQERANIGETIQSLIEKEIEETKEEAFSDAPYTFPQAKSPESHELVKQFAVIPVTYAIDTGRERGEALLEESNTNVCQKISEQWEVDSRIMIRNEAIDPALLGHDDDPMATYGREKRRQAYHSSLSMLNNLGAASAYLDAFYRKCGKACS